MENAFAELMAGLEFVMDSWQYCFAFLLLLRLQNYDLKHFKCVAFDLLPHWPFEALVPDDFSCSLESSGVGESRSFSLATMNNKGFAASFS